MEDCEKFESNNPTIALNVLYEKEMEVCSAYISKYNSTLNCLHSSRTENRKLKSHEKVCKNR